MTTQAKNILEREGYDALREGMAGGLGTARDTVEGFVDTLHGAVVAPVQEVMDQAPILKGVAIGYVAGVLTILIGLLAERQ